MKEFRIVIIAAHRMCISIMLQCMHLCMCKVLIKNIWNKITHYSDLQIINIHYTRLHILKKKDCSDTYFEVWRVMTLL